MPNHVMNILEFEGDASKIKKLLSKVKNSEYGLGTIDFHKITPMPDNIYRGAVGPEEQRKYGKNNWYDWSVEKWGTKFNAYGYDEDTDYSQNKVLTFQTAWSAPEPVIKRLSEMFPDVEIEHQWADEEVGENCGEKIYLNGKCTTEYYPETHKAAVEFSCELWNCTPADYGLILNKDGTDYIDDDNYDG